MRRFGQLLAFWFCGVTALGLWFPLKTEPSNPNHGLTDFTAAWNEEHLFGFLHGCGATPIAPRWIVTAGHLQAQRIFDYKIGAHGIGSHHIVETVPHPNFPLVDLRLYRVKETMVDYAPLAKKRPETNEALVVYGRGKSAPMLPVKLAGEIIGWEMFPWTNGVDGLRVGEIARHSYHSYKEAHYFRWKFTDGPMTAYGDSGHPVFHGKALLGVLFGGAAHATFRYGNSGLCTNYAYIFDDRGLSSCSTPPSPTTATVSAIDLTRYTDWIYDTVSPPVRLSANGSTNLAGWRRWVALDYGHAETTEPVAVERSQSAAPEEVYRSLIFNRGPIEYAESELLRTERYTVRLHFSNIDFADRAQTRQSIAINGVTVAPEVDLRGGSGEPARARLMEFKGIGPTLENVIAVRLSPTLPGGSTAISGLEILLERDGD